LRRLSPQSTQRTSSSIYGFNVKFGLCGCAIPPEILAYTEEKFRAEEKTGFPVGDRRAEETEMLRLVLTFLYV